MKAAGSHEERLELWSEVLQLDEFEVVHQAENSETKSWQLTVVPKVAVAVCPHCGILSREIHQQRDREGIRDLPLGQRAVMLRVRVFEFWCVNCERAFTPPRKSLAAGTHATDRFHVVKNLQERLLKARRELQRELPAEAAQELKGSRWLWSKNPENLTAQERQRLAELRQRFPTLARLADQRESLRALFDDRTVTTAETGQQRLQDWLTAARQLGLNALNAFCKTLENWLPMIANYFPQRSSNGPTEGFNRGFRTILWQAFGMSNFQHFRLRILDRFGRSQPQVST